MVRKAIPPPVIPSPPRCLDPLTPLNSVSCEVTDASFFLPIGEDRRGNVSSHTRSWSLGRADRFPDPGDACACRETFPLSNPGQTSGQGMGDSESEILQRLIRYRPASAGSDLAPRPVGPREHHHPPRLKFEDALRRTELVKRIRKDGILG